VRHGHGRARREALHVIRDPDNGLDPVMNKEYLPATIKLARDPLLDQ
jgi:hypothetical protein